MDFVYFKLCKGYMTTSLRWQGSESGDPLKEVSLLDNELVDVDPETLNCSC